MPLIESKYDNYICISFSDPHDEDSHVAINLDAHLCNHAAKIIAAGLATNPTLCDNLLQACLIARMLIEADRKKQ